MGSEGRGALRAGRVVTALVAGALVVTASAPPASAGLLDGVVGGLLGTVGGVLAGNGFQLGLFDEFAPNGSPTRLGQVRTAIDGDAANKAGQDGTGIDVALIDTGAVPVPGLDTAAAVTVGPDLSFDRQSGLADGLDGYGHGTHLAGIIAGRGDAQNKGIANGSRIVNVKVGASNGAVDVSQVIAAIDWVVQNRRAGGLNIRVINLSYGTDGVQASQVDPLAHAIESAWRNGIVVVVAAGNTGTTSKVLTNPATDPYVITVGAATLRSGLLTSDRVADYSSVGSSARRVDVVAPGTSIISLRDPGSNVDDAHPDARVDDRYFRGTGTSQAAAVASGAIASLLEARPTLTPEQVKGVLRSSARPLSSSPASSQGAGMIDLGAAIKAKAPTSVQTFPKSTGLGSLERARGTVHVALDGVPLVGELDVQGAPWQPSVWAPLASAGKAWSGTTWNGNVWTGGTWVDGAAPWPGRTWKGTTWTGRTWKGDAWTGRTWKGDTWTGRTWKSS
jgi:serine protease AprX